MIKESVFKKSQFHIPISYKYVLDAGKIVVLSYVDDCVYWYKSEALVKWFVGTLRKRFHVKFLVFTHWFISISISQLKENSISVNQARYATSVLAKYIYTITVKKNKRFYKTTFPSDMIFTKYDVSTSDDQVEKLSM